MFPFSQTRSCRIRSPSGFALGSVEGRVAIHYPNPTNPRDNFTFKCHRSTEPTNSQSQDIFAVNDIAFHPQHGTLATVGSDGRFSFWDKDARTKLKTSEQMEQPITRCSISSKGDLFAYAVSYDWSKGHEYYNPQKKNYIFLQPCVSDLSPPQHEEVNSFSELKHSVCFVTTCLHGEFSGVIRGLHVQSSKVHDHLAADSLYR